MRRASASSLLLHGHGFLLTTSSDCLHSYTIYSFAAYLYEFLQGVAVERLIDDEFDRVLDLESGGPNDGGLAAVVTGIDSSPARRSRDDRSTFADLSHF